MFTIAIARPAHLPSRPHHSRQDPYTQPAQTLWRRLLFARAAHSGGPVSGASNTAEAGADDNATTLEADFEAFFRRHHQDIFAYLWRLTADEQVSYDLSQETFIRAWQHFALLRRYDHPAGWLFRVATNLALKHLRHRRVVTRLLVSTPRDDESVVVPAEHIPAKHHDYAEQVAQDDLVRGILLALAPRPRAVLVLHDVYGLNTNEVAQTLSMTRAAVKMMLCRAREQFRIRYQRQEAQL